MAEEQDVAPEVERYALDGVPIYEINGAQWAFISMPSKPKPKPKRQVKKAE